MRRYGRVVKLVREFVAVALGLVATLFAFWVAVAILWTFAPGDRWQPISRALGYLVVMCVALALARWCWPARRPSGTANTT